jgi:hypothetical protein
MLQFHAVLAAGSSRAGLLQDDAFNALAFCTALVCAGGFLRKCCLRGATNVWRVPEHGFVCPARCGTISRPADLLRRGLDTSPNLV